MDAAASAGTIDASDPWLWLLLAATAVVLLWLAVWAHVRYWHRRLSNPLDYDERHRVATVDGSAILLSRLWPHRQPLQTTHTAPPVLIIHGLAINERNCDATGERSLARHLAASGRDVWLLTLRSGRLDHARGERAKIDFTTMAAHDVPLGVAEVLARNGSAQLDLIGFSMGGMLLYATLGRAVATAQTRRVVIIGSPGRVRIPMWPLSLLRGLPSFLAPMMPYRLMAQVFAPIAEHLVTPLHRIVYNPDNTDAGVVGPVLVDSVHDVPWALHRQFARWAMSDGAVRAGNVAVLPGLAEVRVPVRFFAGAADRLAPPSSVKIAFDAWGAAGGVDKTFAILGRAHGHRHDYGHGDLMFGRDAVDDLYAPIAQFLNGAQPPSERG